MLTNDAHSSGDSNDDASSSDLDEEFFVDCLIKDPVCHKCEDRIESTDVALHCRGSCGRQFHTRCLSSLQIQKEFKCVCCQLGGRWCFLCKTFIDESTSIERCEIANCSNAFHASCVCNLDEKSGRKFVCCHHYCFTCSISERNSTGGPFLACIRCPMAYHRHDRCIPAGSVLLNNRWIICCEHKKLDSSKKTNANFCFVCGQGGTLICCENCPCAVHLECYGFEQTPLESFLCSNCEKGHHPMYGDIVWAKFGQHRWWPAEIVHPLKVPDNIERFLGEPGIFIVRFFGTLDYGPVTQRNVYPFLLEDDEDRIKLRKTEKDKKFLNAIIEAKKALLDKQFCQLEELPKYIPIECNRYGRQLSKAVVYKDFGFTACRCCSSSSNPCGDEECENRQIFIECCPTNCPTGARCRNQRFSKKLYVPSVKFMTMNRGFGLRALENVFEGDFVIEYVGEVISRQECNTRLIDVNADPDRAFYFLELTSDKIIDAGSMGNDARFMNHSCDPNCITQRWIVNGEYRIGLFAKRDIKAGEELTFHYNLEAIDGNQNTPCKCGSSNCAGYIGRISKSNGKQNGQATKRSRWSLNNKESQ